MNKRVNIVKTSLESLLLIKHNLIEDQRGFLSRMYCKEEFKSFDLVESFVQINHTLTKKKGTIRGMHFQCSPWAETKVVTCIRGEVFDVSVDIRKDSPTYLQWYSTILSEDNKNSVYIPEGFAHGFQTLTDNCQLIYFHSNFFNPDAEDGLNALDPDLAIQWPKSITEISDKDNNRPMLNDMPRGK